MSVRTTLAAATLAAAMLAAPAAAAPTIYFGENLNPAGGVSGAPVTARAAFLAALSGVSTEDFSSVPLGSSNAALTFTGSAGAINGTLTGGGQVVNAPVTGTYATSATQFYDNQFNAFTVAFTSPIAAFGFYGTDIGDVSVGLQITLDIGLATQRVFNVGNTINAPNGSLLFWGITDTVDTFRTITFAQSGDDRFGFDDMTVGDARQVQPGVPEPATWAMMLLGFGAIGYGLRRQRAAAKIRFA